jgi:hypothetical protein
MFTLEERFLFVDATSSSSSQQAKELIRANARAHAARVGHRRTKARRHHAHKRSQKEDHLSQHIEDQAALVALHSLQPPFTDITCQGNSPSSFLIFPIPHSIKLCKTLPLPTHPHRHLKLLHYRPRPPRPKSTSRLPDFQRQTNMERRMAAVHGTRILLPCNLSYDAVHPRIPLSQQ